MTKIDDDDVNLKPSQVFETSQAAPLQQNLDKLKGSQQFDVELIDESELNNELNQQCDVIVPEAELTSTSSASKLAKLALFAFVALVGIELITGLVNLWQQSPILFGLYSGLIAVILAWAGKVGLSEYRKLRSLKSQQNHQQIALRLQSSMQMGEAPDFINKLALAPTEKQALAEFHQLSSQEHNDAELLRLFEQTVVTEQDKRAKRIVHKYAAESALLLAVSPFALLDMAMILLKNQKMLTELAKCYGIELGYASRIKLTRGIIKNILFAGSAEILTDLGSHMLSLELTGKLSAKLGQGLGGGLLTARLGYQAMALCRPIAFDKSSKPKLTNIHKLLLTELKNFSKNS